MIGDGSERSSLPSLVIKTDFLISLVLCHLQFLFYPCKKKKSRDKLVLISSTKRNDLYGDYYFFYTRDRWMKKSVQNNRVYFTPINRGNFSSFSLST